MTAVGTVIAVGWALLIVFWIVAAFSTKRGRVAWGSELRIRAVLALVVIVLIRVGALRDATLSTDAPRGVVGVILFGLGSAFAVWARVHLGRNWGTPMTTKAEPELVTSGPYRLVRHPIYTGIVLAGAGTAVALNWQWLIVVALAAGYFVYAARAEERYLAQEFRDAYPTYRRSTKMLVPFVF